MRLIEDEKQDEKADDHDHDHEVADAAHTGEGRDAHAVAKDPGEYTLQDGQDVFLDPAHLFHHVQDSYAYELPEFIGKHTDEEGHITSEVAVPNLTLLPKGYGKMSKFMLNELVVALICAGLFIWLAGKLRSGDRPKGRIWNLLETFVVFIRDEVAKPTIGEHDYRRFLPFLLTLFFFILGCNLLGMIPFVGSATGSLAVTAALALATLVVTAGSGMQKMGVVGFLKAQVPHMDLPAGLDKLLVPLMFVIEIFGFLVKHGVLAIRLFANMFAGHLVLAIFLAFIGVVSGSTLLFSVVSPIAVLAAIALSLLELFVAFLQAYVFTFLASLFIGSAQHAH
ncbi:F0F1 ATP synthase subunit A [Mariniblastus fucicola]|uniref:ATP synthase subunit a n=1 Tax=Mariniblastus fucicola TaxID=980251 RepID=A0A5B9PFQ9_9BACT|nr:F0F1 ATP synthase subunit A [Mariniblastus fucicola]QEG24399.1 ATP synthase subunit a [Mariniblastus fucicola]